MLHCTRQQSSVAGTGIELTQRTFVQRRFYKSVSLKCRGKNNEVISVSFIQQLGYILKIFGQDNQQKMTFLTPISRYTSIYMHVYETHLLCLLLCLQSQSHSVHLTSLLPQLPLRTHNIPLPSNPRLELYESVPPLTVYS